MKEAIQAQASPRSALGKSVEQLIERARKLPPKISY